MMEGQKLSNRIRLGERQGPWLSLSVTKSLTESLTHSFSTVLAPIHDGSSLEFDAATAGRECNIQDARDRGLGLTVSELFLDCLWTVS